MIRACPHPLEVKKRRVQKEHVQMEVKKRRVQKEHADGGQEMPEHLTIGTKTAFQNGYAFPYEKKKIASETVYVCNKGSDNAKKDEVLVLRCEDDIWTAYDSAIKNTPKKKTLMCRQPVFRCLHTDITRAGWHQWQMNYAASTNGEGVQPDWQGALKAETRVP